ncbi:hypothetical protein GXW82_17285 [Streptacidiphilus sp. 4-A2]|nr:hypothetical protein [Streptacidiphilus sp. 4-A2]
MDMTRQLHDTTGVHWARLDPAARLGLLAPAASFTDSTDRVHSTGALTVVNGAATVADGQSWAWYSGTDDVPGQWYQHLLAAKNGYLTADTVRVSGK